MVHGQEGGKDEGQGGAPSMASGQVRELPGQNTGDRASASLPARCSYCASPTSWYRLLPLSSSSKQEELLTSSRTNWQLEICSSMASIATDPPPFAFIVMERPACARSDAVHCAQSESESECDTYIRSLAIVPFF